MKIDYPIKRKVLKILYIPQNFQVDLLILFLLIYKHFYQYFQFKI